MLVYDDTTTSCKSIDTALFDDRFLFICCYMDCCWRCCRVFRLGNVIDKARNGAIEIDAAEWLVTGQ